MDPLQALRDELGRGVDGDKVRRAFRVGYKIPQIVSASGWSHGDVYFAVEGYDNDRRSLSR